MMRLRWLMVVLLMMALDLLQQANCGCTRIPKGANGDPSVVDESFKILIDGNPQNYILGQSYNVSLSCPVSRKFVSFTIVVESEQTDAGGGGSGTDKTGHFELLSGSDVQFNSACENMIENTNTNVKTRIDVAWVAPSQPNSGCVLIKAAVVQHRDVWFIDDGMLTKRICAEQTDELTPNLEQCCACDEAKYEIILQRNWARNTHAKDFPKPALSTRLGELIGASHSYNYRFWEQGSLASQGLRDLAQHGSTRALEQEIREGSIVGDVRTIVKAPGIGYRENVMGTTLANARVDSQHHQISLVTKIEPSPDWVLGVSGLELCLSNCTWLEQIHVALYPLDIGTDAGASYMSADAQQVPPDVIRRITSTFPSDYRSPFFDESGAPIKPLATLYLNRKRLFHRDCDEVPQEGPLECATHPWQEWNKCSTRCGQGVAKRERSYKSPTLAASYNCQRQLEETRSCEGTECGPDGGDLEDVGETPRSSQNEAQCELTMWSEWSGCSKACGRGVTTRTRDFRNPQARQQCMAGITLKLEERMVCTGTDCGGVIPGSYNSNYQEEEEPEDTQLFGKIDERPTRWNTNTIDDKSNYNSNNYKYNNDYNSNNNFDTTKNYNMKSPYKSNNNYDTNNNNYDNNNNNYNNNYNSRGTSTRDTQPDRDLQYGNTMDRNDQFSDNKPMNFQDYALPTPKSRVWPTAAGRFPLGNSRLEENNRGDTTSQYNVVQDYCYQKPYASTAPCLAKPVIVGNFWFYDHDDQSCKLFTTDNCDENRNKFRSLDSCEGTCLQPLMNVEQTDNTNSDDLNQRRWGYSNSRSQYMTN